MAARVLAKDLDARLVEVERKLDDLAERIALLDSRIAEANRAAQSAADQARAHLAGGNGNGHREAEAGRIEELAAAISRLDERVEKITHTLVAQASRWA
jgi:prefoldin subunit 5